MLAVVKGGFGFEVCFDDSQLLELLWVSLRQRRKKHCGMCNWMQGVG